MKKQLFFLSYYYIISFMKVLLISEEYPFGLCPTFGGGGSHVFYLAFSLVEIGVEVFILAYKGASKRGSLLENFPNVHVFPCDFGKKETTPEGAIGEANRICKTWKPDVVHGHHLKGGFVGLAVASSFNLPIVLTMHKPPKLSRQDYSASIPLYQRSPFYTLWHSLAIDERIRAHIAYSRIYEQENLDIGVPKEKIKLIYHGVPVNFLERKAKPLSKRQCFGLESDCTVVVCPLRPEKPGVDVFIHAAKLVQERIGDKLKLRFIVTGNTKSLHYKKRIGAQINFDLAKSLSLEGSVIFRSFKLRQMWQLFHRAQVCVIPSWREGLSIALLEAMALGAPVVASDVHGINEVISHEESGLLVQPGHADDLAEEIVRILSDRRLSNFLLNNAKELCKQKFSAERMAKEHLTLYNTLIQ